MLRNIVLYQLLLKMTALLIRTLIPNWKVVIMLISQGPLHACLFCHSIAHCGGAGARVVASLVRLQSRVSREKDFGGERPWDLDRDGD